LTQKKEKKPAMSSSSSSSSNSKNNSIDNNIKEGATNDFQEMKESASYQIVRSQIELCELELERERERFGSDAPQLARPLGMLGLLHQHMAKDLSQAIKYHEEAKRILCKELNRVRQAQTTATSRHDDDDDDDDHDKISEGNNDNANVDDKDDQDERRKTLTESLAVTITDLAFIHERTGDVKSAKEEFKEAYKLLMSIKCSDKHIILESCARGFDRTCRAPHTRIHNPVA